MGDDLQQLLAWEEQARKIVAEGTARAQAMRDEAERRRSERVARAKREATTAAAQARTRLIGDADRASQASQKQAETAARQVRTAVQEKMEAAVQAVLQWLVGGGPSP